MFIRCSHIVQCVCRSLIFTDVRHSIIGTHDTLQTVWNRSLAHILCSKSRGIMARLSSIHTFTYRNENQADGQRYSCFCPVREHSVLSYLCPRGVASLCNFNRSSGYRMVSHHVLICISPSTNKAENFSRLLFDTWEPYSSLLPIFLMGSFVFFLNNQ